MLFRSLLPFVLLGAAVLTRCKTASHARKLALEDKGIGTRPNVDHRQLQILTTETQKLIANDGSINDYFGYSVAISNEVLVVGAYQGDGSTPGYIYVFETNDNGQYEQVAKLGANDGALNDQFGRSVAVANGIIVVGAYRDDDNGTNSGSVYVFEKNGNGKYEQIQKLVANDGAARDYFGKSVAVWNGVIVVGAHQDDDNSANNSGSAYVFEKDGTNKYVEKQKLVAQDGSALAYFGVSVSISGGLIVVGAYLDGDKGDKSGSVYVFEKKSDDKYEFEQKLYADDIVAEDQFGHSVAVSNGVIVIGATKRDDKGTNSGAAYVFEKKAGGYKQVAKLVAEDGDSFDNLGFAVDIADGLIVVGAYLDDDKGDKSGTAYVFKKLNDGKYKQIRKIAASDGAQDDRFGRTVAVSNGVIAVGAYQDDDKGSNSGSAYVFGTAQIKRVSVSWEATDSDKIVTTFTHDPFTTGTGAQLSTSYYTAACDGVLENGHQAEQSFVTDASTTTETEITNLVSGLAGLVDPVDVTLSNPPPRGFEDATSAQLIQYCLRLTWTEDAGTDAAMITDFMEVDIAYTAYFDGAVELGGDVSGTSNAPADGSVDSSLLTLSAFVCDDNNGQVAEPTVAEGEGLRFCVSANQYPTTGLVSIDKFSFTGTPEEGSKQSQHAIYEAQSGTATDSLTSIFSCDQGSQTCAFTSTLKGEFYLKESGVRVTTPTVVTGSGTATLQIGGVKRRRNIRVLRMMGNGDTINKATSAVSLTALPKSEEESDAGSCFLSFLPGFLANPLCAILRMIQRMFADGTNFLGGLFS